MTHQHFTNERQTYNVRPAAKILGVGANSLYDAIRRGEFHAVKIGKRLVISRNEIERVLAAKVSA